MDAPLPPAAAVLELVSAALARRRGAPGLDDTDVIRLVHAGADDLPGLVVDRYGDVARVEAYDPAWAPRGADVAKQLFACEPALRRAVLVHRDKRAGRSHVRPLIGAPPRGVVVHERGMRLFVRPAEPDAVGAGVFADLRLGRAWVRERAAGGPALNLFAHAGAFGVALALGGSTRVDQVDAAKKCAPWAAFNLALNGVDPRRHRFLVDDVFKILARAERRGPHYRVIVCDPPTTALRPGGRRFVVSESLGDLAKAAFAALVPGGALLLSTNDRSTPRERVEAVAREAAVAAGRSLASVTSIPLGPDLPPSADPWGTPVRAVGCVLDGP